ncbi:MAG: SsrA-binding protein SmpB [Erysipelotrichales bacterium]|nr:SsrA-binding protein SmpB [Erysipelotrichales bacterium]
MNVAQKIIAKNSKASFNYFLSDFLECGLSLVGTEIKALRVHGASLNDSYVIIRNNEAFIVNMHIAPYDKGNIFNHDPLRTRKLLLHKKEILKLGQKVKEKQFTIIPTKVYLVRGKAKLEIALGKGKKLYDKRDTEKARDDKRKIDKAIKSYNNK